MRLRADELPPFVPACGDLFAPNAAQTLAWPQLRWLASACWGMLALVTVAALNTLYVKHTLPEAASWIAWAILWASGEYAMLRWSAGGTELYRILLTCLHAVRTGGPPPLNAAPNAPRRPNPPSPCAPAPPPPSGR